MRWFLFAATVVILCIRSTATAIDWQWKSGRASWYGDGSWPLDIGGCNYGYIWDDEKPKGGHGTGWDAAALSDVSSEYVDSCGLCFELRCDPTYTSDLYGSWFDRTSACYDSGASVLVRIIDTCPCTYAPNAWGNKRWCCGDRDHFDVSMWAFEKLADLKWGVIPLQYRQVPCTYTPDKEAPALSSPSPHIPLWPPAGAQRSARDWPDYRSTSITPQMVFEDSLQNGFQLGSWSAWLQPLQDSSASGMLGGPGLCASISNNGAIALSSWEGIFKNTIALEFWTYVGVGGWQGESAHPPDITINVAGPKGSCAPVRLMALKPFLFQPRCLPFCTDYWWAYKIYLPAFAGADPRGVINDPSWFGGCGGNAPGELNQIQFRHDGYGGTGDHWLCLDHIILT